MRAYAILKFLIISSLISMSAWAGQIPRPLGKSKKEVPLITWKDYRSMKAPQKMALIQSLKGVIQEAENKNKNKKSRALSSTPQRGNKFFDEWVDAGESVYKNNQRLMAFDIHMMLARKHCDKQRSYGPSRSCENLMKISRSVARAIR